MSSTFSGEETDIRLKHDEELLRQVGGKGLGLSRQPPKGNAPAQGEMTRVVHDANKEPREPQYLVR